MRHVMLASLYVKEIEAEIWAMVVDRLLLLDVSRQCGGGERGDLQAMIDKLGKERNLTEPSLIFHLVRGVIAFVSRFLGRGR
jgi:hypothetical protein